MKNQQDYFEILRSLTKNPNSSQREIAKELGFSLGKINYCMNELKNKGFSKSKILKTTLINLITYTYLLQKVSLKTKLTINFMKRKMHEYDELKKLEQ